MKKNITIAIAIVFMAGIGVLAISLPDWHFPKTSSKHRPPNKYDLLYENIAINHNRPEFCERISSFAYLTAGWGGRGSKVNLLRSSCFMKLAINQRNPVYCDKVKPINTWFLDGSKNSPDYCRASMSTRGSWGATYIETRYVKELLDEMEFNYAADSQYRDDLSRHGDEEAALAMYWLKIIETEEFVSRAMRLPQSD